MPGVDVLLVSLGSTVGWRAADAELAASLERAGATVAVAAAEPPRDVRTFAATDLVWARAAASAAREGIAAHEPRAIIYCTITAALLWPRPGAIRFDALAAVNRPGRHGVWQRPLERRRLRAAPLLVPLAAGSLEGAPRDLATPSIVVHTPVEASGPVNDERDIDALMYAVDARKKGLARVLAAWAQAHREGEELQIDGTEQPLPGVLETPGVRHIGRLSREEYRAQLKRTRVYVTAPRREDYGIAPLEALANGCRLVSTPAPGAYPALAIARALDPRLVGDDLATALRIALDEPPGDYAERAALALTPFSNEAVDRVVREELLPRLLALA